MNENGAAIVMPTASTELNLHDIIKERKAERKQKTEEKRQKDRQRIKDMKSTTGIDPLQRFPKEVWEMIFNELNPEDRGNVYQVHPLFRDLLEKNKVRDILFPQIIKLPEFQYPFDPEYDAENYCSLRRVSKSMMNAVDRWAEDNLKKTIRKHGTVYSDGRFSSVFLQYEIDYEREDVKNLLASFEGKGRKRFFVKALTINFPSTFYDNAYDQEIVDEQRLREMFQEFKNDTIALMELIGDQILHFRLDLYRRSHVEGRKFIDSPDEIYMLLQRWTSLMPNLEWLELELKTCYPKGMPISSSALGKYPFPHLPSLERITFEYGEELGQLMTPQLCTVILEANQHVKMIDFEEVDDSELHLLPTQLIQSLPLTYFSIENARRWHKESTVLRFQHVQPMINLNWKLKAIKLELHDPEVSLNDLLQLLGKFSTLEKIILDCMSGVKMGYNGNFDYLRLPNLTDLQLNLSIPDINYESNVHFYFSLQFLLYCSKLKTLDWKLWFIDDCKLRKHLKKYEDEGRGKTLDFRAGLKTLYDSNIWDVFPYLENVQVDGWKRERGDDVGSCYHQYKREDVVDGMSVGILALSSVSFFSYGDST